MFCMLKVYFTFLFFFPGTQESQEEAAAGWGWFLQRVLHVWAEPDPGVQGGKIIFITSHILKNWSCLAVRIKVLLRVWEKGHSVHCNNSMYHLTSDLTWGSNRPDQVAAWMQECPHQHDRTVNTFFQWHQLPQRLKTLALWPHWNAAQQLVDRNQSRKEGLKVERTRKHWGPNFELNLRLGKRKRNKMFFFVTSRNNWDVALCSTCKLVWLDLKK